MDLYNVNLDSSNIFIYFTTQYFSLKLYIE